MKQMTHKYAGLLALAVMAAASSAVGQESAHRMTADHNFTMKAAQGGMAEVKLGQLAEQNGGNPAVKAFGHRMVTDHTKANDDLKAIAARKGVMLPSDLDPRDQATYDRLSKLNGAAFDKAYMKDMVADHRTDAAEFRRESEQGTDPDIKAFAARTLPILEEHLKMAEETDGKVKGEK